MSAFIDTACAHCGTAIKVYPSRKRDRNYCSRACGSYANGGHPKPTARRPRGPLATPRRITPLRERLEKYYEPEPNTGCLLWIGAITWRGYGTVERGRRGEGHTFAHRAMYELEHGPVPPELDLDHKCRLRRCGNDRHLEPVTRQVNIARGYAARRA